MDRAQISLHRSLQSLRFQALIIIIINQSTLPSHDPFFLFDLRNQDNKSSGPAVLCIVLSSLIILIIESSYLMSVCIAQTHHIRGFRMRERSRLRSPFMTSTGKVLSQITLGTYMLTYIQRADHPSNRYRVVLRFMRQNPISLTYIIITFERCLI